MFQNICYNQLQFRKIDTMETKYNSENNEKVISSLMNELTLGFKIELRSDGTFKIDFETPLELALGIIALFSFFMIIVEIASLFIEPLFGDFSTNWYYYSIPVGTLALSLFLRIKIDNYYIFDRNRNVLLISRSFFGYRSKRATCPISDIVFMTFRGSYVTSKTQGWWSYNLVLVLRDGRIIKISDDINETYLEKNIEQAEKLAKELRLSFEKPHTRTRFFVRKTPVNGIGDLQFRDEKSVKRRNILLVLFWSVFVSIIILGVIFLLAYFTDFFPI